MTKTFNMKPLSTLAERISYGEVTKLHLKGYPKKLGRSPLGPGTSGSRAARTTPLGANGDVRTQRIPNEAMSESRSVSTVPRCIGADLSVTILR